MSGEVLLVGGPMDGQVMVVRNPQGEVAATVFDNINIWRTPKHRRYIPPPISYYRPQQMIVFGTRLYVHVWPDTPIERIEATLSRMLLSPQAHRLAHVARGAVFDNPHHG